MSVAEDTIEAAPFGSEAFWRHFVETHWEKAPVVFKQPLAPPLLDDADLFSICLAASNAYRGEGPPGHVPRSRATG